MASKPIYQIYAELQDYEPKIWRRFQVMNDITMARLAYILMTLFEMKGSHLYLFEVDELNNFIINNLEHYNKHIEDFKNDDLFKIGQYGCIFEDDDIIPRLDKRYRELKDAKDVKLKWILDKVNEKMEFQYDFGDNWRFNVVLEKIFEDESISGRDLPRVIEGERFGIIEDCGGIIGLEDIKKAFEIKKGEDYEMYSNWLGTENLDLNISEYVTVNFETVRTIVDQIGGVEMNITSAEAKSIPGITTAGKYNLNGEQALAYARIRKIDTDYKRTERMRNVLSGVFYKAQKMNVSELNSLLDTMLPHISTNISPSEILSLIPNVLSYNITESEGWPYNTRGWEVGRWYGIPVTLEKNVIDLHKNLFGEEDYEPTQTVKDISNRIIEKTGFKE